MGRAFGSSGNSDIVTPHDDFFRIAVAMCRTTRCHRVQHLVPRCNLRWTRIGFRIDRSKAHGVNAMLRTPRSNLEPAASIHHHFCSVSFQNARMSINIRQGRGNGLRSLLMCSQAHLSYRTRNLLIHFI